MEILVKMLPEDMYARSTANEQRIRDFTIAINRRGGRATFEQIMVEVSDLGSDEIRAILTLVNSEATEFKDVGEVLNYALSDESQEYQSTIRILKDNGWLNTRRDSEGLKFALNDSCYEKLEWF